MKISNKDRRRFWNLVFFTNKDGCWFWHGYVNTCGHGRFKLNGKTVYAHRFALASVGVEIPEDKVVRHLCNQMTCVNPKHLKVGTHQENTQDCIDAGNHAILTCPRDSQGNLLKQ